MSLLSKYSVTDPVNGRVLSCRYSLYVFFQVLRSCDTNCSQRIRTLFSVHLLTDYKMSVK
jgi:hypothetical protein